MGLPGFGKKEKTTLKSLAGEGLEVMEKETALPLSSTMV